MAGFGKVLGKVAAGALALGGLILAGKTGFGKNLGENPEEEKDPLGGDLEEDEAEETPDEEGEDEEE